LHCGSDCISDPGIRDMPFEDFINSIRPLIQIYKRDSITVVITGGEPLLRKDLTHCGRVLRENGFRWGIVTNGFDYNSDIHSGLLAAGMGSITLSVDGFEETHNWLRGNSRSFKNAVGTIDLITQSDRLFYDIVTCVNSKNIDELPELKAFFISKNVKAWRLFTIAPIGRARDNDDLQLKPGQIRQLMEFISTSRKDKKIDTKFSCESYTGAYEKKIRDSFFFCRAGINIASVLIDGSISACPNINRSFVQGNIYRDSFVDIWEHKFEIMRDRTWTKTGNCLHCSDYDNCNGGAMHLWDEKQDCIMTCLNKELINRE
jgi:radical SAM enzyme (rSAM/lipoprotein system)